MAGQVTPSSLPFGRVARLVREGSFDDLPSSWERLGTWIEQQGHQPRDEFREVYLTEPSPDIDPADLRTELNWAIAD